MKPVVKGLCFRKFTDHKQAKPLLVERLGAYCSYCESPAHPRDLDVEHIYPATPHPALSLKWGNFLLSCTTCNTYKSKHQKGLKQSGLWTSHVWPHRENTFRAFDYGDEGEVTISRFVSGDLTSAVEATLAMTGLMKSPAVAETYEEAGIAYDGVSMRKEMVDIARSELVDFEKDPTERKALKIARYAAKFGFFSIWMNVFCEFPEVRHELIRTFKADRDCFDILTSQAIQKLRL